MLKLLFISFLLLIFSACVDNNKPIEKLDGKKLTELKCASCHNLNMPPIISNDELAPPMMAIAFHMRNFVKPENESQRTSKAKEFVVDYMCYPSLEKAFCDKESLKRYGLMPSQKENLTQDEAKAIASYMFRHYTQENLTKIQKEQAEYDAHPPGKKIALQYRCLGCHKTDKKIIGPSLTDIAHKYVSSKSTMINSIKNGSKGRWSSSNGAIMPPFKQISDNEMEILSAWILTFNPQ